MNELLHQAVLIAIDTSFEVMRQYKNGFKTEYKKDHSPLTSADKAAHIIITDGLSKFNLPVLSEEGNHLSHTERQKWEKYWIIDPIDGTSGFVKKTDEFSICIALVENKKAVLGIIVSPAKNLFYFGAINIGAYKFSLDFQEWKAYKKAKNIEEIIEKSIPIPIQKEQENYVFLTSKSYKDETTKTYIEKQKLENVTLKEISMGSALKFGLLAEGFADEYSRLSPLHFWDIAAGDAILKSAGINIVSSQTNEEILYTHPNMKIEGFYAKRKA